MIARHLIWACGCLLIGLLIAAGLAWGEPSRGIGNSHVLRFGLIASICGIVLAVNWRRMCSACISCSEKWALAVFIPIILGVLAMGVGAIGSLKSLSNRYARHEREVADQHVKALCGTWVWPGGSRMVRIVRRPRQHYNSVDIILLQCQPLHLYTCGAASYSGDGCHIGLRLNEAVAQEWDLPTSLSAQIVGNGLRINGNELDVMLVPGGEPLPVDADEADILDLGLRLADQEIMRGCLDIRPVSDGQYAVRIDKVPIPNDDNSSVVSENRPLRPARYARPIMDTVISLCRPLAPRIAVIQVTASRTVDDENARYVLDWTPATGIRILEDTATGKGIIYRPAR